MFRTMSDVKEANRKAGQFWFSPDTMRFFKSRVETPLIKGRWFVTSEQYDERSERRYSVRVVKDNGGIDTVGEFQAYRSKADAIDAIDLLTWRASAN